MRPLLVVQEGVKQNQHQYWGVPSTRIDNIMRSVCKAYDSYTGKEEWCQFSATSIQSRSGKHRCYVCEVITTNTLSLSVYIWFFLKLAHKGADRLIPDGNMGRLAAGENYEPRNCVQITWWCCSTPRTRRCALYNTTSEQDGRIIHNVNDGIGHSMTRRLHILQTRTS